MQRSARPFGLSETALANSLAEARIRGALRLASMFREDPEREARLEAQKCLPCFYITRMGGAAMTSQPCACCGTVEQYGSTNTDALCKPCAHQHGLCKHCGGHLNHTLPD